MKRVISQGPEEEHPPVKKFHLEKCLTAAAERLGAYTWGPAALRRGVLPSDRRHRSSIPVQPTGFHWTPCHH